MIYTCAVCAGPRFTAGASSFCRCDLDKLKQERNAALLQINEVRELYEWAKWHWDHDAKLLVMLRKILREPEKRVVSGPKIEHCQGVYCLGTDKCQCKCYSCLQIVNF